MTRLRALNDLSSDECEDDNEEKETAEAQEERAFSQYKKALELRYEGKYPDAEQLLISLLDGDFLGSIPSSQKTSEGLSRPAVALKYACLKNLGDVLVLQDRPVDGQQCLIQAVELDGTDVTLWHQLGNVALQVDNFHLASHAFQEGLHCNPRHWPCLDALLPVLFALDDYLGCLVLAARAVELDPDYPQALALCSQIAREQPSLLTDFNFFFPREPKIQEIQIEDKLEDSSTHVLYAQSLQERCRVKNEFKWDKYVCSQEKALPTVILHEKTWLELGNGLLKFYTSLMSDRSTSFLHHVKLALHEPQKDQIETSIFKDNTTEVTILKTPTAPMTADADADVIDVDSEQEAKVEDQTEEDATEASGHEQEEEHAQKDVNVVLEINPTKKRKRKKTSTTLSLIDQWSKRRSGRRPGRKAEEKEYSNLASRFRSFLPDTLLTKDLEVQIERVSKKRSARDPIELLAWAEDSMDTMDLYRFFQERDAKEDFQRQRRHLGKDDIARIVNEENYFGKSEEFKDISAFMELYGMGTKSIIEIVFGYVNYLSQKDSFTWPSGLVPVFMEAFECMRRHFPHPSPLDVKLPIDKYRQDAISSLLYCELYVNCWQLADQKDKDKSGETNVLANALGQLMLLICQNHLFSSFTEQCKLVLRFHWVKVHLSLLQEIPLSAINSLQDIMEALEQMDNSEAEKQTQTLDKTISESKDEYVTPNIDVTCDSTPAGFKDLTGDHQPTVTLPTECKTLSTVATVCDLAQPNPPPGDEEILSPAQICQEPTAALGENSDAAVALSKASSPQHSDVDLDHQSLVNEVEADRDNISEAHFHSQEQEASETILVPQLSDSNGSQIVKNAFKAVSSSQEAANKTLSQEKDEVVSKVEPTAITEGNAPKDHLLPKDSEAEPAQNADKTEFNIILPNAHVNHIINKVAAHKLLLSLTRQQQLSEIDNLYRNQNYEAIAGTLTECFKFCAQLADAGAASDEGEVDNLPDRPTQMAMLLDSLWQLQRYGECFYWTEACLHEAFNRYLNCAEYESGSKDGDDQQMWATTIERLLAGLEACLKAGGLSLMGKMPRTCLTRLVQTLTSILCQQLERSDSSLEMAIECTTPWLILHRAVYFEEQHLPKRLDVIPASMRVIFTGHEYMAKLSRCCLNEGILLNLILDVVVPVIRSAELSGVRSKLTHHVEQAIYCLYGHPKKARDGNRKKLQDHKVPLQPELTWDRSLLLLRFYEPDELPTFDSSTKISADEESLFLRILKLIPDSCKITQYHLKMKAYVMGKTGVFPIVSCPLPEQAQNLYYFLADYYLKTFKWEAAVKYYMLDVSVNPNRFDSWAGMALARAALLTTEINSCDTLKNDVQLIRNTKAQICFQKAVDLDPENATMWIEYGNFAYVVHSFCSRLLKTETESLSLEMFTKVEEEKDKLLTLTETCFKTAEKLGQEERWLHQYMLGKVAEKRGERPFVFLRHYRAAAKLLYESNAEYPSSLNYDPPQTYAFEAHEVHYRIHASILKTLESMEGKPLDQDIKVLFEATILEAACSPFMAQSAGLIKSNISSNQTCLGGNELSSLKRKSTDQIESAQKKSRLGESVVTHPVINAEIIIAEANLSRQVVEFSPLNVSGSTQEVLESEKSVCQSSFTESTSKQSLPEGSSAVKSTLKGENVFKKGVEVKVNSDEEGITDTEHSSLDQTVTSASDGIASVSVCTAHEDVGSDDVKKNSSSVLDIAEEGTNKEAVNKMLATGIGLEKQNACEAMQVGEEDTLKCKTTCSNMSDAHNQSVWLDPSPQSHVSTNGSLLSNLSVPIKSLPGVGFVGGVNVSSKEQVHGMSSVVKEHDYAAPYGSGTNQCVSHRREEPGVPCDKVFTVSKCADGVSTLCRTVVLDGDTLSMDGERSSIEQDTSLPLLTKTCLKYVAETRVVESIEVESGSGLKTAFGACRREEILLSNVKTQLEVTASDSNMTGATESPEVVVCDVSAVSGIANTVCHSQKSCKPMQGSKEADSSSSSNDSSDSSSDSSDSSSAWSNNDSGRETGNRQDVAVENGVLENAGKQRTDVIEKHEGTSRDNLSPHHLKTLNGNGRDKEGMGVKRLPNEKSDEVGAKVDLKLEKSVSLASVKKTPDIPETLDHAALINPCLTAMQECLVRYPRHYKSFYRLCHYYFRSKEHKNLKKCRQLLLEEYRVVHAHKSINGLFKFVSINTMFNDVWRIPVEEVDRAGSFASHMSRCVVLLMELLRDQRDHNLLLKLSLFLKKEPEKKDKKYLRDNERVDLSKQALGMCMTALRICVNQITSDNSVVDLYLTVKEGMKELSLKEASFKTILSDAFKKARNIKSDSSMYDAAAEFCQNELNLRKALAQVKAAQTAQAAQAVQAAQMSNFVSSPLYNAVGNPRFPSAAINPPIRGHSGSPIFMPKIPASRGRGRPPKARHNNPLQWFGMRGPVDQSQFMRMIHQGQRPRMQQPPASTPSLQSSFMTDIAKDRPSISITALQMGKNVAAPSVTSVSSAPSTSSMGRVGGEAVTKIPGSMDSTSRAGPLLGSSPPWPLQPRARLSAPRFPAPRFPGGYSPRNNMGLSSSLLGSNPPRKDFVRFMRGARGLVPPTMPPPVFQQQSPRSYVPRARVDQSVSLLSRLPPGLQVEQRTQAGSPPGSHPSKYYVQSQREAEATVARQHLNQIQAKQKMQSAGPSLPFKSGVSISKVVPSTRPNLGSSMNEPNQRNIKDSNVDIITLD